MGGLGSIGSDISGAAKGLVSNPVQTLTSNPVGQYLLGGMPGLAAGQLSGNLSGIGNALGISSGAPLPSSTPIAQGVTTAQTGQSNFDNQQSLISQQNLLAALAGQSGLNAQSQALGSQQGLLNQQGNVNSIGSQANALMGQQQLNNQLSYANGVGNQAQALASQQQLARQQQGVANQYQGIVNGTGPNPAMAALNQSTGQNIAAQNALMAGQRGASSNVGLLARQAAQQGAATQQQAVGQGATMQANQSLNALSGLSGQQQAIGNTQQNVANIAGQQVGAQQTGVNAQQQAASNLVAQQQAQQQAVAGQANTLAGQTIGQVNQNTSAQQSEQQVLQNALAQYNQQNVAMQGNINTANAGINQAALQGKQALTGGLLNSGATIGAAAFAQGGEVEKPKKYYDGDLVTNPTASSAPTVTQPAVAVPTPQTIAQPQGPQSSLGQSLKAGFKKAFQPSDNQQNGAFNMAPGNNYGAQALQKGVGSIGTAVANWMNLPSSKDPFAGQTLYGGQDSNTAPSNTPNIPDSGVQEGMAAKGGMAKKHDYRGGGNVKAKTPAQKAVKAGNSYSNDKIPAVLSEGEVVIPRSVMQGQDPARGAADFVAKVLAKRGRKSA